MSPLLAAIHTKELATILPAIAAGAGAIYVLLPRPKPHPWWIGTLLGGGALLFTGATIPAHRGSHAGDVPVLCLLAARGRVRHPARDATQSRAGRPGLRGGHSQHLRVISVVGRTVSGGSEHHHLRRGHHRHLPVCADVGPTSRAWRCRRPVARTTARHDYRLRFAGRSRLRSATQLRAQHAHRSDG